MLAEDSPVRRHYHYFRKIGYAPPRAMGEAWTRTLEGGPPLSYYGSPAKYGREFTAYGRRVRWVENPESMMRLCGTPADFRCEPSSFACDYYGHRFAVGVVYRLPSADGHRRYVPAVLDPDNGNNQTGEGPALFCFTEMVTSDRWEDENEERNSYSEALKTAAQAANKLADAYAEEEYNHSEAWEAGREWREAGDEMQTLRDDIREIFRDAREEGIAPNISDEWEKMEDLRRQRDCLKDGDGWENRHYWFNHSSRPDLRGSFNDGAEHKVFITNRSDNDGH